MSRMCRTKRLQTAAEGMAVELNAGDGVVYSNFLLHTGSNYTTKKRRTLPRRPRDIRAVPGDGVRKKASRPGPGRSSRPSRDMVKHMKDATEAALRRRHRRRRGLVPDGAGVAAAGRGPARQDGADESTCRKRLCTSGR